MTTIEGYRNTHSELRQMIRDLEDILRPDFLMSRPNAKTAFELLMDLAEKVRSHLANEDRGLYPTLLIHDDPKVKSIAWGFISGERPLRKVFDDYQTRWLADLDFDCSDEFIEETREIVEMLAKRIEREEQILLPKLLEIGLFQERPRGSSFSA